MRNAIAILCVLLLSTTASPQQPERYFWIFDFVLQPDANGHVVGCRLVDGSYMSTRYYREDHLDRHPVPDEAIASACKYFSTMQLKPAIDAAGKIAEVDAPYPCTALAESPSQVSCRPVPVERTD